MATIYIKSIYSDHCNAEILPALEKLLFSFLSNWSWDRIDLLTFTMKKIHNQQFEISIWLVGS